MRSTYPSDITREQFEFIRYILESACKITHPYVYDLYEIFCAILYIVKEGVTWRAMPHDFPKWQDVYYHFRKWGKTDDSGMSPFGKAMRELVISERVIKGREAKTSMVIVDSKSIKNTDIPEEKGYDGGKKVSGIKLHIGVDTNGLPHAIKITTADVTDRNGALEMFKACAPNLTKVVKTLMDGGYTGENFANAVEVLLGAEVEIAERSELHKFVVIPKRWVVERTFAWLEKYRRLWKNCERLTSNSLQMTIIAFIRLLVKRY